MKASLEKGLRFSSHFPLIQKGLPVNNILIIDDNREIHNSLRPIAAAHGYSLLSAYDGLSGLSMAQSCGADLIILDVMLPQSIGFAL